MGVRLKFYIYWIFFLRHRIENISNKVFSSLYFIQTDTGNSLPLRFFNVSRMPAGIHIFWMNQTGRCIIIKHNNLCFISLHTPPKVKCIFNFRIPFNLYNCILTLLKGCISVKSFKCQQNSIIIFIGLNRPIWKFFSYQLPSGLYV
jgi:hypothetical protein